MINFIGNNIKMNALSVYTVIIITIIMMMKNVLMKKYR